MLYFDYKRKAASEDSLDHVAFYLIGDASYTAFTCILLWSKLCREPRYASPALDKAFPVLHEAADHPVEVTKGEGCQQTEPWLNKALGSSAYSDLR